MKLYIQDKYVGTSPWPKNDEERKLSQLVPGMYRVRAEKDGIFPIDTSIFISELGKSYKEKLYTRQKWSGLYKYDYKPLTVLVELGMGVGWSTDSKYSNPVYGGHVDVTLRHWLHRKPLPTKLRFAIDYQLQGAFNRFKSTDWDSGYRLNTSKNIFSGSIQLGPSLTWTPTQRGFGQLSVYAHLGYQIGEGTYYSNLGENDHSEYSSTCSSNGFASSFGLSFAFNKIGIAGEYVGNQHRHKYVGYDKKDHKDVFGKMVFVSSCL